ncbi:MAG: cysteine hydrolase [Saprospiraceae bacterium]
MNPSKSALLLVDMQNDFLHPVGAYGRAKINLPNSRARIEQMIKVSNSFKELGSRIISANFTLIADKDNIPIIPADFKATHPFLNRGDFQYGRWGHQLIDELGPADFIINKITYSAFKSTHLEWLLQQLNIKTLILGGIISKDGGGLVATLTDAQSKNYETILLMDGCLALTDEIYSNTLKDLENVCKIVTCKELVNLMNA